MTFKTTKLIITPIDGSPDSLRSLNYLNLLFGAAHNLNVILFYVLPSLPPMLVDECKKDPAAARQLKSLEAKNEEMAERILKEAKGKLVGSGFSAARIETAYRKKEKDTARDICWWAESKHADAMLVNTRGRSRIEAFFMGETARKILDFAKVCPVWLLNGSFKSKEVLIAMDSSDNALRAVDHAGFILSGTDCKVTLFHSKRQLRRFLPKELLKGAAKLEEVWKKTAAQDIAPHMQTAKQMLIDQGLDEKQIQTKIIDGSRSAAVDILKTARTGGFGTIVMGRKGVSQVSEYELGSITRKVAQDFDDMALWVVK